MHADEATSRALALLVQGGWSYRLSEVGGGLMNDKPFPTRLTLELNYPPNLKVVVGGDTPVAAYARARNLIRDAFVTLNDALAETQPAVQAEAPDAS